MSPTVPGPHTPPVPRDAPTTGRASAAAAGQASFGGDPVEQPATRRRSVRPRGRPRPGRGSRTPAAGRPCRDQLAGERVDPAQRAGLRPHQALTRRWLAGASGTACCRVPDQPATGRPPKIDGQLGRVPPAASASRSVSSDGLILFRRDSPLPSAQVALLGRQAQLADGGRPWRRRHPRTRPVRHRPARPAGPAPRRARCRCSCNIQSTIRTSGGDSTLPSSVPGTTAGSAPVAGLAASEGPAGSLSVGAAGARPVVTADGGNPSALANA